SLHQQNILISNVHFGRENDFAQRSAPRRLVVHLRLHEVANDLWAEQANQIRHKEKAVLKDSDHMHSLALVIAVDLARKWLTGTGRSRKNSFSFRGFRAPCGWKRSPSRQFLKISPPVNFCGSRPIPSFSLYPRCAWSRSIILNRKVARQGSTQTSPGGSTGEEKPVGQDGGR